MNNQMADALTYMEYPHAVEVGFQSGEMRNCDNHYYRFLSDMQGMYQNLEQTVSMLARGKVLIYEVYEKKLPELSGELQYCTSITYPGKVGQEYFMTKGHFHSRPDTAEIYLCLRGQGLMLMESPKGESRAEEFRPGRAVYVPAFWAHRSVNTGGEPLLSFCIYPGDAGHAYGPIEEKGFRKIVLEHDGRPTIVDNPRYRS